MIFASMPLTHECLLFVWRKLLLVGTGHVDVKATNTGPV